MSFSFFLIGLVSEREANARLTKFDEATPCKDLITLLCTGSLQLNSLNFFVLWGAF